MSSKVKRDAEVELIALEGTTSGSRGIWIKGKREAEIGIAVKRLIDRFPMLLEREDEPSDLVEIMPPYYAYDRFAAEIIRNHFDSSFLRDACIFIDELADSGEDLLEELLIVSVLAGLASDPIIAGKVRERLNEKAVEIMRDVEEFYYGRPKA